jgi:hypothetical protein
MTDSEYTDCEYDCEYEEDIRNDIYEQHDISGDIYEQQDTSGDIYEPEEQSLTRFNITLCELYNNRLHGYDNSYVKYHYLVQIRYKSLNLLDINYKIQYMTYNYNNLIDQQNHSHNIFRNYQNIIKSNKYIKPEISECIYLDTGHCVAIKKTIWIKLIQRTWKKIFKNRELILKKRCQQKSLIYRDLTGKWPNDCKNFPRLKGMLSSLKV